jgi:phosphoglycerate kinase
MIHYLRKAKRRNLAGVALLRLDFNTKDGDWRMEATLPTVRLLARAARAVVIMSHRGRPAGNWKLETGNWKLSPGDRKLSLEKDTKELSRLLKKKVFFVPRFDLAEIKKQISASPRGSIFLLENVRFLKGETENSRALARRLAVLGDFFVNDCFAVSHRADASFAAITRFLPSYAGLELESEMQALARVMARPKRPLALVLGGAKAADKLGVLDYFKNRADSILLGGGAANTVLALRGLDVQKSLRDTDPRDLRALRPLAARHNVLAPVDYVWQKRQILDIGPKSVADFSRLLSRARTIIWSGPLGLTDKKRYQKGTLAVARAIAAATKRGAFSVVGGGETVEFLRACKLEKKFSFISTGGGAMLDFLANKKLPGIEALKRS